MPLFEDTNLSPAEIESIETALRRDPALRDELEMLARQLSPDARVAFWRAFAGEANGMSRPAAAVLNALEDAIRQADSGEHGGTRSPT